MSSRAGPPRAGVDEVALIRRLYEALEKRVGEADSKEVVRDPNGALAPLSAGERALYVLVAATDEVTRNGFEGLYYSLEHLARATAPDAADQVTAGAFRRLFDAANQVAFSEAPRKRAQSESRRIMHAVRKANPGIRALDTEFESLMADDTRRIEAALAAYVRAHPDEFQDPELIDSPT